MTIETTAYAVYETRLGKDNSKTIKRFETESSARAYFHRKVRGYEQRGYTRSGSPFDITFVKRDETVLLKFRRIVFEQ